MSSENNKVFIEIKGARQNNLKGIDVKIPLYTFNVVCGPSGSGKSSLAFETLYAEGQRRYTETLSNYARQYVKEATKPLLDDIKNIPPPLLLGQKNPVRSSRSTVGTHSEVLDLLRIIFSKLGVIHCPQHKILLQKYSPDQGAKHIMKNFEKGFLLCPVEKIQKKDQTATLNKIRREGFSRIAQLKKNKLQIQPLDTVKKLPSSFFIVIDRLVFSDRKRISDSLAQCFATSIRHNPLFQSGLAVVCDFNNNIQYLSEEKMCSICRYQFPLPITPSLFSFNSTLGACNECRGFGNILCLDEDKIIPNPYLTIEQGAIHIYSMPSTRNERRQMKNFCKRKKININKPWYKLSDKHKKAIFEGDSSFRGIEGMFQLLENKRYKMHVRMFLARYKTQKLCPVCKEGRLRKETLQVLFQEKSIADWTCMTFEELDHQLNHLQLSSTESLLIKEVLTALRKKVHLINKIGLGYLQLNRPIKTLSGGEFQRLNLVHQISGGLSQVLYILDEPTVGLHSRDSER